MRGPDTTQHERMRNGGEEREKRDGKTTGLGWRRTAERREKANETGD